VPLLREPLDVAVPLGHRLADRDRVRPDDLVDEAWIMVREGFPVAAVLDAVAARAGRAPRIVQRINDFHVVSRARRGRTRRVAAAALHHRSTPRACAWSPSPGGCRRRIDALLRPDRAERLVVRRVLDELVALAHELTG
jgi:hypothetical protein